MSEESRENKFVETKPEEGKILLQSGIPTNARLMIWTEGQKFSFTSRIHRVSAANGALMIAVPKEGGEDFEEKLRKAGVEECLFSLNLPTDVVFFRGQLRPGDESALNFKVSPPVYKVQRRRNLRLPVSADRGSKVRIQLSASDSQPIEADLMNVSEGGVGVLVQDEAIYARLPQGKRLAIVSFTLDGHAYQATGEVRYAGVISGAKTKKQYRIGIQFVSIDRASSDRLANFVFEESSKYLGRM